MLFPKIFPTMQIQFIGRLVSRFFAMFSDQIVVCKGNPFQNGFNTNLQYYFSFEETHI